jgi:hypothetical protein
MLRDGTIGPRDLDFLTLTDDPGEAVENILRRVGTFGLRWKRAPKAQWVLGENGRLVTRPPAKT